MKKFSAKSEMICEVHVLRPNSHCCKQLFSSRQRHRGALPRHSHESRHNRRKLNGKRIFFFVKHASTFFSRAQRNVGGHLVPTWYGIPRNFLRNVYPDVSLERKRWYIEKSGREAAEMRKRVGRVVSKTFPDIFLYSLLSMYYPPPVRSYLAVFALC